jgi:uncharacterized damage-inducible protein DinB
MNTELLQIFKKLEKDREQLLNSLTHLSPEQYHRNVHGKWSASQILTHLLTSERLALIYMKKKSRGLASLNNSGWLEPIKLFLLQVSQRLPIRYKAPKPILDHTPPALGFDELKEQWSTSRMELKIFLETIDEENVRKMIFKHPVAGRFNATQGLTFLHEHMLHHLPQIKRLL